MENRRYLWFELHHRIIKAARACNFGKEGSKKYGGGVYMEVAHVWIQCRLTGANGMEKLSWRISRGCGLAVVIEDHNSRIDLQ